MKKKKINLQKLQVESFVTDMKQEETLTAKGGFSNPPACFTIAQACPTLNYLDSCGNFCIPTGDECLPG